MTSEVSLIDVPGAPSGSPHLRGYLSRPAGDGPWPAVVVIHEAFSIDDVMKRQVDRLAAAGYLALMPDLFTEGGARKCLSATLRALRSGHGRAYADIEAARAWLVDHPDSTGRVGIIGFCMGGGFALMCATRGFEVAADNYGFLPKDPQHMLAGACPIVASYGGRDRALAKAPARLEQTLTAGHVEHEITVYPDAGHSFLNDAATGPAWLQPIAKVLHIGPEPASARPAWAAIEAFFGRHLAAPVD